MSAMQGTYNGYNWKFIPTKPKHQHIVQIISPHIPTITLGIISLNLIQWHSKSWSSRTHDILAYLSCLTLHTTNHPWASLSLAITYTIWQTLPGSFSALTLPSHAEFMRTLKTDKDAEKQDCMICWDDELPLALLPCNHKACPQCLRLMGQNLQTACPLCRHPLFSQHDTLMLALSKATVCTTSLNVLANIVVLAHYLQHRDWFQVAIVSCFLGFVAYLAYRLPDAARSWGREWWRPSPQKSSLGFRSKVLAFCFGLATFVHTVWVNDKAFS